jgi:hypothetical protein
LFAHEHPNTCTPEHTIIATKKPKCELPERFVNPLQKCNYYSLYYQYVKQRLVGVFARPPHLYKIHTNQASLLHLKNLHLSEAAAKSKNNLQK